jgi:hypothetical protein
MLILCWTLSGSCALGCLMALLLLLQLLLLLLFRLVLASCRRASVLVEY